VTYTAHASPYDPAVAESNKVAAVSLSKLLKADCRVVKDEISANKTQTQAIVVTGETQAVKDLRKELIDAHTEIEHLRDIVRKLVKASQ
jgi:hypothetical protein